jgi:hypothetical protein
MNLDKAREIVDVFGKALEGKNTTLPVRRKSELKGYPLLEIDTACKLIIAVKFLEFTGKQECDDLFKKVVGHFGFSIYSLFTLFVEDDEFNELNKMDRISSDFKKRIGILMSKGVDESNLIYQQFLRFESMESFGNFCHHIGPDDPLYWQKIYTHLNLPYNDESSIDYTR